MTITVTRSCDRCGIDSLESTGAHVEYKDTGWKRILVNYEGSMSPGKVVDLCPRCFKDHERFLIGLATPGVK